MTRFNLVDTNIRDEKCLHVQGIFECYTVNLGYNGPGYNGQNLAVNNCEFFLHVEAL
jgi:hypothetical protein